MNRDKSNGIYKTSLLGWFISIIINSAIASELPALPSGLSSPEPSLPIGIESSQESTSTEAQAAISPWTIQGFIESRYGRRTQHPIDQKKDSIAEARWQIQAERADDWGSLNLTLDLLFDSVEENHDLDIDKGLGWLDLREAYVFFRLGDHWDIKAGRQVLTWGTGDLVFINDLFPKDWNAFLIGRHENYLKAPSDAVKIAWFGDGINLDLVVSPKVDTDRFIDGRRISYFSMSQTDVVGQRSIVTTEQPDRLGLAFRLYGILGQYEVSGYGYRGTWKSPAGFNPVSNRATFPDLSVLGASIRGPLAKGVGYTELGYYYSEDNKDGRNPLIRNSEWRALVGYEQDFGHELTANVQYYLEAMDNYDEYSSQLAVGQSTRDQYRHVVTTRLTQLMFDQRLVLSAFNFWSPSDEDGYLRVNGSYALSDQWRMEIGVNQLYGNHDSTFFGQLESNNNVYLAVRYSYQ